MTWLSVETLVSGTSVSSQSEIVLGSSLGLGAGEMVGREKVLFACQTPDYLETQTTGAHSSDIIRALIQ